MFYLKYQLNVNVKNNGQYYLNIFLNSILIYNFVPYFNFRLYCENVVMKFIIFQQ